MWEFVYTKKLMVKVQGQREGHFICQNIKYTELDFPLCFHQWYFKYSLPEIEVSERKCGYSYTVL